MRDDDYLQGSNGTQLGYSKPIKLIQYNFLALSFLDELLLVSG